MLTLGRCSSSAEAGGSVSEAASLCHRRSHRSRKNVALGLLEKVLNRFDRSKTFVGNLLSCFSKFDHFRPGIFLLS
jgi:hypothetical protein